MPANVMLEIRCSACGRILGIEDLNTEFTYVAVEAEMCPNCVQQSVDAGYAEGYQAGLEARL